MHRLIISTTDSWRGSGTGLDLGALYHDPPTSTADEPFDGVMFGMAVFDRELDASDVLCISNYYLARYRDK